MQFYPTQLRLSVRGSDRSADGVLVIQLPCPPSVGLHIADVYSQEPLYVDDVVVSAQSHTLTAWCSLVEEKDIECHVLLKCFVGEWEWTFYESPAEADSEDGEGPDSEDSDEPTEPDSPQPKADRKPVSDEWYKQMAEKLTRGRNKTPGDN